MQRQHLTTEVAEIPSDFLTKDAFLWTLNFSVLAKDFLGMFAHLHCSSKSVPSTCWNNYNMVPDLAEIPGTCSRCVINSLVTAVAILCNKLVFIILNSKFWTIVLVLLKSMNCFSYSLAHFMEQEITKLYDPFSSIYSSFLMCKLKWVSLIWGRNKLFLF